MGEPVTSKITLIILPVFYKKLGEKIEKMFEKKGGVWYTLVYPVLVGLVRFLTLPLVLAFIAASIGMDILKMLGRICNSTCKTTAQVSSNTVFLLVFIQQTNTVYFICKATW